MKLVIDIPEDYYKAIKEIPVEQSTGDMIIIQNGIPLPKGHGDLIDRQALINNGIEKGFCDWYDEIKCADAIIEADKAERSDKE